MTPLGHGLRALLGLVVGALALTGGAARAELWAHVDAQGVIHFANHQVDDRYELFMRGGPTADSLRGLTGLALPPAVSKPSAAAPALPAPGPMVLPGRSGPASSSIAWPASAPAPSQPARIPRLVRFIEQSPVYHQIRGALQEQARLRGLDADLVKAVIAAESGFNPMAVSHKGAIGLMQLMPATAERWGVTGNARRPIDQRLTDIGLNLATGIRHLRHLIDLYPGRLDLALAAYNAGEGAVQRAGQRIPDFRETRDYVSTVLALYASLRAGEGSGPLPVATAATDALVPSATDPSAAGAAQAAAPRPRSLPTVPGRANMPPSLLAGSPFSSNSLD